MKVVFIGFRMDEANSVHYEKIEIANPTTKEDEALMGRVLHRCIDRGSHAVSIRFVQTKDKKP